jgi:hypothetical protein
VLTRSQAQAHAFEDTLKRGRDAQRALEETAQGHLEADVLIARSTFSRDRSPWRARNCGHERSPVRNADLLVDVVKMDLDRTRRQTESIADHLVGQSYGSKSHHLALARREGG